VNKPENTNYSERFFDNYFWAKSRSGRLIETGVDLLDTAIGFGLISFATVAAVLGKFLLTVLFGLIALGVFIRIKRRKITCHVNPQSHNIKRENDSTNR
jgi:hypothetical protein